MPIISWLLTTVWTSDFRTCVWMSIKIWNWWTDRISTDIVHIFNTWYASSKVEIQIFLIQISFHIPEHLSTNSFSTQKQSHISVSLYHCPVPRSWLLSFSERRCCYGVRLDNHRSAAEPSPMRTLYLTKYTHGHMIHWHLHCKCSSNETSNHTLQLASWRMQGRNKFNIKVEKQLAVCKQENEMKGNLHL